MEENCRRTLKRDTIKTEPDKNSTVPPLPSERKNIAAFVCERLEWGGYIRFSFSALPHKLASACRANTADIFECYVKLKVYKDGAREMKLLSLAVLQ